jgi:hypothetical protein
MALSEPSETIEKNNILIFNLDYIIFYLI